MEPYMGMDGNLFGNPNAIHYFGQRAHAALDDARQKIADSIHANRGDMIFTASATEANNLVLRGAVKKFTKERGKATLPHIIISAIEHDSIYETARDMEREGVARVSIIPVSPNGIVDVSLLEKKLDDATAVVSVMWVNNETGVLQPVHDIGALVRHARAQHGGAFPFFHSDAAQACVYVMEGTWHDAIDALTLSSHKIYGPKGAGMLCVTDVSHRIAPLMTGGGQEQDMRSGTQDVPAIVGYEEAMRVAALRYTADIQHASMLMTLLWDGIHATAPDAYVHATEAPRSPFIMNVCFPGHPRLDIALDMRGIAVSSGSACAQRHVKPSHVLAAMGVSDQDSASSIRISIGRHTTKKDITETVGRMAELMHS